MNSLSAEAGGRRTLRSVHSTYLKADCNDFEVGTDRNAFDLEHWYIEDHNGKVVLKTKRSPGLFISGLRDGRVILTNQVSNNEKWIPFKNDDGTWSFESAHGNWLKAYEDGLVTSGGAYNYEENFFLGWW